MEGGGLEEIDLFPEDRPERSEDEPVSPSEPFELGEDQKGIGLAIGLAIFLLPVGLMVGVMRWNIAPTLDADLEWILTKFCDTVLVFCIVFPICPLLPGDWGSRLSRRVFKGLFRMLTFAKWVGILAFASAALAAFGYIFWMLWRLVSG